MSEELLIRHCAPTLAGLKMGNLFSTMFNDINLLQNAIKKLNSILNPKGVTLCILKVCGDRALVYVYRSDKVKSYFNKSDVREFLYDNGYMYNNLKECIDYLSHKICLCKEFPHEIGLFLGYPLEDIKAFISNKGKNCKCSGCWKVYFNEEDALKTFARYKKCTDVYCKKFSEGLTIEKLTVAV